MRLMGQFKWKALDYARQGRAWLKIAVELEKQGIVCNDVISRGAYFMNLAQSSGVVSVKEILHEDDGKAQAEVVSRKDPEK